MPLKRGWSPDVIAQNVQMLRREGREADQAVAIAYNQARESFKARNPGKPLPKHLRKRSGV